MGVPTRVELPFTVSDDLRIMGTDCQHWGGGGQADDLIPTNFHWFRRTQCFNSLAAPDVSARADPSRS